MGRGREKEKKRIFSVIPRVYVCLSVCFAVFPGVQVMRRLCFLCALCYTVESSLQGTCVSIRKLSSWSPLWESLAVKLILLSHTPVSVPHLSAQPQGPPCTPGFASFLLTSRLLWLAAPIGTEQDKSKRGERVNEQEGDRMRGGADRE